MIVLFFVSKLVKLPKHVFMNVIKSEALSHAKFQAQSWPFIIQRMWLRPSKPDPRL